MEKKLIVGILYGGKSVEHAVSVTSARTIAQALDSRRYRPILIPVDETGTWRLDPGSIPMSAPFTHLPAIALIPASRGKVCFLDGGIRREMRLDVVFPIIHGTNGEDGTLQGLLELVGIAYVGPGVAAAAASMDKDMAKRLWREAGLPVGHSLVLKQGQRLSYAEASRKLGAVLFVKPAHLGSSVGISKVHNRSEFMQALRLAFQYDDKVLVEEFISGREIEVAVLGNTKPQASLPGEVIPHHEFYSYAAKYLDPAGAGLDIPARLTKRQSALVRTLAAQAFQALDCEGMARVDFFLRQSDGKFFLNEINPLPGFTAISMYPKLWEATGLPLPALLDHLITLALERHQRKHSLRTSYAPGKAHSTKRRGT